MIIVSASGMLTGGRVLHHLARFGPDRRNTILLTGYQAAGTRGRHIQEGAKSVKVHGEFVPINAQVVTLDGLSAHADQGDMLGWLSTIEGRPQTVYVTHGEPEAAAALKTAIVDEFGWDVQVPADGSTVELR
jgi:metallo-beta-lactamase family protein